MPERRQERSLGVEARERRGLVTTCSPAGSSANSSSCRPRRKRKPLPRAQERGRGREQTGPSWAPGPASLSQKPRPKGSLPWGDSPSWSHTNHLPCQSYAGLGSTRNKNEHKTSPILFPGPSLRGQSGEGSFGGAPSTWDWRARGAQRRGLLGLLQGRCQCRNGQRATQRAGLRGHAWECSQVVRHPGGHLSVTG